MFDICFLCVVYYLYGWIVLYQCQIVIYIVGRFIDWFVDELVCGIVIGFECFYQFVVFCCEGFFISDVVNWLCFCFCLCYLLFIVVIIEL